MEKKSQLLKKLGNMSQIAGIRKITIEAGKAKGTNAYEVYNRAGLRFTVMPDKCMDIFDLSYKGINLSFQTKNGMVANKFFNALDNEFLYYWGAGMLNTCGLANAGPPCTDEGLYRTEHGRISMTPADNVCAKAEWEGDDFKISLSGEMKETIVYGSALKLSRTIKTSISSKEIIISDTVENLEPKDEEFMLLYHLNFGYPLLDEETRFLKPEGKIFPREERFKKGIDSHYVFGKPQDGGDEEVFFHENYADESGYAYAALINNNLELGAYVKYSLATLPHLVHWKSIRSHDYAVGIEPSNTFINGRTEERKNGTLPTIQAYGRLCYEVILGVLDGNEEIKNFEEKLNNI